MGISAGTGAGESGIEAPVAIICWRYRCISRWARRTRWVQLSVTFAEGVGRQILLDADYDGLTGMNAAVSIERVVLGDVSGELSVSNPNEDDSPLPMHNSFFSSGFAWSDYTFPARIKSTGHGITGVMFRYAHSGSFTRSMHQPRTSGSTVFSTVSSLALATGREVSPSVHGTIS